MARPAGRPCPVGRTKKNHVATNPGRGRLGRVATGFIFGENHVASRDMIFHAKEKSCRDRPPGRPAKKIMSRPIPGRPTVKKHVATNPGPKLWNFMEFYEFKGFMIL